MSTGVDLAPTALDKIERGTSRSRVTTPPRPTPLVLVCEICNRCVYGDAGFLVVDRRTATAAREVGQLAPWFILHRDCCPRAVAPLNPYVRIWASKLASTDDLLDALAELSRQPWFRATDFGSVIRRILADTAQAAGPGDEPRAYRTKVAAAARGRRTGTLAPDDPRHGTIGAYSNWGCRCDACRAANTGKRQRDRAQEREHTAAAPQRHRTAIRTPQVGCDDH